MQKDHVSNYSLNIKLSYVTTFIFLVLSVLPALFLVNSALSTSDPELYTNNVHELTHSLEVWRDAQLGTNGATGLWTLFPAGIVFLFIDATLKLDGQILQLLYVSVFFFIGLKGAFSLFSRLFGSKNTFALFVASIFYMYNIIVARIVGGAYPFLMSYAFIPIFLSYFIKYTQAKQKRDIAICGLTLAMIFGPNLVFGFVALFAAGLFIIYGMIVENFKFIKNVFPLMISALISLLLIAWWFLPSFLLTKVAADDVATVINSEDFYNLDTGPTNLLRSLGDWAFFSGHQGTPYVHYASHFLKNPLIIFGGFLPFLALLWVLTRKNIDKYKQILFAALLFIPTMFIIGGTNKEWVTSGVMCLAFEKVSSLLIFRNTYKFSVLVIIAFCIAIYFAISRLQAKPSSKIVKYGFIVLLFLPAFPLYLNSSASDRSLIDEFPNYWQESADTLNSQNVQKALLLPDQYFSVFDWNGETKSLGGGFESALYDFPTVQNTCKGCAIERSQRLIQELTLGFQEPNYAKMLQLSGISHIIQRNDYDAGFYGVKNAQAIDPILATRDNINKVEEFGQLSVYAVDNPYPNIYSPSKVVINSSDEIYSVFEGIDTSENYAVFDDADIKDSLSGIATTTYDSLFHDLSNIEITETSLSDNFSTALSDEQVLSVKLANPIFSLNNPQSNFEITGNVQKSQILPTPGFSFDEAVAQSSDYVLGEKMIGPEAFSRIPEGPAGNCRPSAENAVLNRKPVIQEGYIGLEITADKDLACTTIKPEKIELDKDYLFWFDYKITSGDYFGYCVSFDGGTCKKKEILVGEPGVWHRYYIEFSTKNNAQLGASTLFFYAPAFNQNSASTVEYANIEGYEILRQPEVYLQKNESFSSANYSYEYKTLEHELVPDSELTGSEWTLDNNTCGLVLDSSIHKTSISNENNDDYLELESFNTLSCTGGAPFSLENDAMYVLEIDRRVLEGDKYGYCLLVGGECLVRDFVRVDSNNWETDRYLVNLNNQTNGQVRLYLYGSDDRDYSKVQFKKASIRQLASFDIPKFGVSSTADQTISQLEIQSANKTGRSEYSVVASAEPNSRAMLVFLQSYSTAWSLDINGMEIPQSSHVPTNYFANGWVLDIQEICGSNNCEKDEDGNYILIAKIVYKPQQILPPSILISASSYFIVISYVVISSQKKNVFRPWKNKAASTRKERSAHV